MKAKMIWIAVHPDEPDNVEVSFIKPEYSQALIHPDMNFNTEEYCEYKQYVCIEVEVEL